MSHATPAHGPTFDSCRYCWMCRHVCPTGFVTKRESHTPHGYALLIASATRGVSPWNADTVDALYTCADCGCCESHCATHQPLPEAIVGARAGLAAAGLAPAAALDVKARLETWGSVHGDPGTRPAQAKGPIGLFVGDQPSGAAGGIDAALRLLARAGVAAVPVGVGRSTGLVASSLGFVDTAKGLARAVLADVAACTCSQLLVLGPGDRFAFEKGYATRLGVTWPEGVRVREATAVLAEALAGGSMAFQPPAADAVPWAYQEPDHAVRVGDRPWPRQLLTAALGAAGERRPLRRDERAHPCGTAGGLDLTQPAVAAGLAEARVSDARSVGAARLITEDPACVRHLRAHAGGRLDVVDLFELLASRLAGH